jgi:[acyl-carrier-protein] S-malonyltransferase
MGSLEHTPDALPLRLPGGSAILFPGQGSQKVGMGRELAARYPAARLVYEEADDVLGLGLSTLCFEGPEAELGRTANTQPAILATSIAVYRVLHERGLRYGAAAGHSLGEWSALVATGALALADALRLTRLRGQLMQEAVPQGVGAMAALLGLTADAARAACERAAAPGEPVEPANLNGAGQIVISGHAAAVDRAIEHAKAAGAQRATKLAVSAPFHCSLMAPAAEGLAAALASVAIAPPAAPVIANVTAAPVTAPEQIRALLVRQVTASVRWEESVQLLASAGVTRAYELGAGAVLRGLVKRITKSIETTSVGEPADVEAALPAPT